MLRVWSASGHELVSEPPNLFRGVPDLKRHLRTQHGYPVCLQQLLQESSCLEEGAVLEPVDLQLVVLSSLSAEQLPGAARELYEYAARQGHVEVARRLLDLGVDMEWQDPFFDMTALMRASCDGHQEIVALLLEAGCEKDLQHLRGPGRTQTRTALMHESNQGHVEVVRLLLKAGAGVDLRDPNGTTALICATDKGHVDVVRLLLEAKASSNLQDLSGSALMHASDAGHVEVARLLLDAGAHKDAERAGMTALMRASYHGHVETARLLIQSGAELNKTGPPMGMSALMHASDRNQAESVLLLLEARADKNLKEIKGRTACHLADEAGAQEVIERHASMQLRIFTGFRVWVV